MEIVNWGILSTANINRKVIPAINDSKRGKLIAVASRDIQKAKNYASSWNIPINYGSYDELTESDKVDAIYISLPNHLHAEWCKRAMLAGKHVLCEKPITLSIYELDELIKTSKETGCIIAEAFMYRHHPQTKIAMSWVNDGKLGEVFAVHAIFNFLLERVNDIRREPNFGGGSLWDVGVYPVSFANMVFGNSPNWVQGIQSVGESGTDEVFSGSLIYSNNHYAQISSSFQSPFYTYADIIGTQGVLTFSRPFTNVQSPERKLFFHSKFGDAQEISVPEEYLYTGEIEDMHDAILESKTPFLSLEDSKRNIETILALYTSASQNGSQIFISNEYR